LSKSKTQPIFRQEVPCTKQLMAGEPGALGSRSGSSKPLLLQSSGDNCVVVALEKHEFFARVHDHDTEVYRRLPLRRKGCRAGAVGVDLIRSGDRKRGKNRPVRADGYGAFERSCSVQG
jgi:hypothetical protein